MRPWLGHLMVSRQETSRQLLTPGEVMQLPPEEELILVSGCHPTRAKKARYYEDDELKLRILPPPRVSERGLAAGANDQSPRPRFDDWAGAVVVASAVAEDGDPANGGIRREPELPEHEEIAPKPARPVHEFEPLEEDSDDDAQRLRAFQRNARTVVRQASLDPSDDLGM